MEALRISEERYRNILESIQEGYFEVDLAGNFTFFNEALCSLYGYSENELKGMNYRQYTDQENAKKLFQIFHRVYTTGESVKELSWESIRKDTTKKYVEASVSLIKDSSGKSLGFRGIIKDVTERKKWKLRSCKAKKNTEASWKISKKVSSKSIWPAISPSSMKL